MRVLCRLIAGCLLIASCDIDFLRAEAEPVAFTQLPGWPSDHVADALAAFARACGGYAPAYRSTCVQAQTVRPGDDGAARAFFERRFRVVPLGTGRFTGYFEIEVRGSRRQGGAYQIPVMRRPVDPGSYSRSAIATGALAGQGLEMAWLADPADLFFLQLQGGGRIRLAEGGVLVVGSAGSNGYGSIATEDLFGDAGIPGRDLSISGIRAWISAHPMEGQRRLSRDQSYVYFQQASLAGALLGHRGESGAPLVPLRSVAVDKRAIQLGAPVWIDVPDGGDRISRMMVAHDTGALIEGSVRIDLFYGWGPEAEARGGHLNTTGRVWQLVPIPR